MATINNKVEYELSLQDGLTPKIESAGDAANKFESSLGNIRSAALSVASALGLAFGLSELKSFAMGVVDSGSKVENALTGLTTLLKDHAAAKQVIDNTMKDAMVTPFAFEGLLSANKALISAGINAGKARQDVLNLANAIAATGGGDEELQRMVVNLQGISNTGKATAMDIRQFAIAGVNIYKVLENAGIKVKEGNEHTAVTYDQLTYALQKAHEAGGIYYNGLENMAGNTSVKISNLGDSLFQLKVQMFNDLKPAIDKVIGSLGDMIVWLKGAWEWVVKHKEGVKELGTVILNGIEIYASFKGVQLVVLGLTKLNTYWTGLQAAATATMGDGFAIAGVKGGVYAGTLTTIKTAMSGLLTTANLLAAALFLVYKNYEAIKDFNSVTLPELTEKQKATDNAAADRDLATEKHFGKGKTKDEKEQSALQTLVGRYQGFVDEDQKKADELKSFHDKWKLASDAGKDIASMFGISITQTEADRKNAEYISTLASLQHDKQKLSYIQGKAGVNSPTGAGGMAIPPNTSELNEKARPSEAKTTNIHIQIGEQIHSLTIQSTTVESGVDKIKDHLVAVLAGAINDSQRVAHD